MPDDSKRMLPYHKLGDIDWDRVLQRIAAGEYQSTIAKELGCTPAALCMRLRDIPEAAVAREVGIEQRLDSALAKLEDAAAVGDLNLARVHDTHLRRLEWRAAVECPSRWGQRQQITHDIGPSLADALATAQRRVSSVVNAAPHTIDNSDIDDVADSHLVDS